MGRFLFVAAVFVGACSSKPSDHGDHGEVTDGAVGDVNMDGVNDASDGGANTQERVLLFGGHAAGQSYLADTWEWDGTAWLERSVTGASARETEMAAVGGKALLFGGITYTTAYASLGGTWEFSGTAWTQNAVPGPSARTGAAIGTLGNKVILFGGSQVGGSGAPYLGDTWQWDGAAWTQLQIPGPSARSNATMATLGNHLILFGGQTFNGTNMTLGDTWEWDGTAWTKLTGPGPGARMTHMATLGDKVVLFGGISLSGAGPTITDLGDTWQFDGATWTKRDVPGPSVRAGSALATLGNKLVLFGGSHGNTRFDETWSWDGNAWTHLAVTGPSARGGAAMTTLP